jgi:hypothetical protein
MTCTHFWHEGTCIRCEVSASDLMVLEAANKEKRDPPCVSCSAPGPHPIARSDGTKQYCLAHFVAEHRAEAYENGRQDALAELQAVIGRLRRGEDAT